MKQWGPYGLVLHAQGLCLVSVYTQDGEHCLHQKGQQTMSLPSWPTLDAPACEQLTHALLALVTKAGVSKKKARLAIDKSLCTSISVTLDALYFKQNGMHHVLVQDALQAQLVDDLANFYWDYCPIEPKTGDTTITVTVILVEKAWLVAMVNAMRQAKCSLQGVYLVEDMRAAFAQSPPKKQVSDQLACDAEQVAYALCRPIKGWPNLLPWRDARHRYQGKCFLGCVSLGFLVWAMLCGVIYQKQSHHIARQWGQHAQAQQQLAQRQQQLVREQTTRKKCLLVLTRLQRVSRQKQHNVAVFNALAQIFADWPKSAYLKQVSYHDEVFKMNGYTNAPRHLNIWLDHINHCAHFTQPTLTLEKSTQATYKTRFTLSLSMSKGGS